MTLTPNCSTSPLRVVLLGVGNILLSDEGVGVRLVERLAAHRVLPASVTVLDGGTCAMEMLEDLENLDVLVIADCVRVGRPPASVVVMRDDEVPAFFRTRLSPHQIGLSDVLATLRLTGRAPAVTIVVGVQPESMALGLELTDAVAACLPQAEDALADALHSVGVPCPPRQNKLAA